MRRRDDVVTSLHSIDDEEALIGGLMMADDEYIGPIMDRVQADMFWSPSNQIVYSAIFELYKAGVVIDLQAVLSQLRRMEATDQAGGAVEVTELFSRRCSPENLSFHAGIVSDLALRRRVLLTLQRVEHKLPNRESSAEDIRDALVDDLYKTSVGSFAKLDRNRNPVIGPEQYVDFRTEAVEEDQQKGIPFYLYAMDEAVPHGSRPGEVTVIAGRTSMGKTLLKGNFQVKWIENGHGVFAYTPQMSSHSEYARMESIFSQEAVASVFSEKKLRDRKTDLDMRTVEVLRETRAKFSEFPLWVWDRRGLSCDQLMYEVDRLKQKGNKIDIVTIDLVSDLKDVKGAEKNLPQAYDELMARLRIWAQRLEVPVVVCHQINREAVKDVKKIRRPQMQHLKSAGAMEEEPDLLLLVHRPHYFEPTLPDNRLEVIIEKQRHDKRQMVAELVFEPTTVTVASSEGDGQSGCYDMGAFLALKGEN